MKMGKDVTQLREDLEVIEEGIRNLEELWSRLQKHSEMKQLQTSQSGKSEIQEIALKITSVRELINKIDIKLDEIEARIGNIESLEFRSRSDF
jgi:uncharacterized protein (DUF342 family)